MKTNKKPKIGRWILLFLIIVFVRKIFYSPIKIDSSSLAWEVLIKKWDNFQSFTKNLAKPKQFALKFYVYFHKDSIDLSKIQEWTYVFSGEYSKAEFLDVIAQWPKQTYKKYTVLEGWSIYDIDFDLSKKWLIKTGDYISFVTNSDIISKYVQRYEFLSYTNKRLSSLEWFLYPDTYHLDIEWNFIDQLVYLQLDNFNKKVWTKYSQQIKSFSKLDWYDLLTLATVIEKEEKNNLNKATIAGIFFNRLSNWMRLDADITLCYGLKEPYETCTPAFINKAIYDKSNLYNTRQNGGLPPQAIANPSAESIDAVLNSKKTDYFFYLHDAKGNIHYGKTLAEHNDNKNKYLR